MSIKDYGEDVVCLYDLDGEEQWDDSPEVRASATSDIAPIYSKDDIYRWLKNSNSKPIEAITLHHTYSPSTCNGRKTVIGIKNYHVNVRGFSDIAANFYSSDEEDVIGYTARPLSVLNGAHAYISKDWSDVPKRLRVLANGNKQYLNYKSFGIETFGNFDVSDPENSVAMRHSIMVMAVVCDFYGIDIDNIFFHNMVAHKSCPGERVKLDWIKREVEKEMGSSDCKDLPPSDYALEALEWAKESGLMTGDSTGNLMPKCNITREDFIVVLYRFYKKFVQE